MFRGSDSRITIRPGRAFQEFRESIDFISKDELGKFIEEHTPNLWLGSMLSCPSGMPSGKQLMEELISALLRPLFTDESMDHPDFTKILDAVVGTWCLEDVFDRAREYGVDVSTVYYELKNINETNPPNEWHYAVAKYYLSKNKLGMLITTNWDDLLEQAFEEIGNDFQVTSSINYFASPIVEQKVDLHHIHGSFKGNDVVTSLKSEHRDVAFPFGFYDKPVIFIGYGGYEPSVYEYLYTCTLPQIWIVYDENEFDDPKKARLLRRENVKVYKGDLQDVLELLDDSFKRMQWQLQPFTAKFSIDHSLNSVLLSYALMSRRMPDAIIDTYHMVKVPFAGNPFLGRAHDFEPRRTLIGLAEIIVGILLYTVRNHNIANSIFCHSFNLLELGGDGIAARIVASYMLRHTINNKKAIDLTKVLNQPVNDDTDCLDQKCRTKSHSFFNDMAYEPFSKILRGEKSFFEKMGIQVFMEMTAGVSETPGFLGEHYEIYAQWLFREGKYEVAAATFNHAANFHFLGAQNTAGILCYNTAKKIHAGEMHSLPPSLKLTNEIPIF
jgi:hypothetical protein